MKMKIGADLSDANIVFLQYPRLPCARITWTGKNKSAHAGAFVFSPEMKRSVTQDNSGENRFIPSPWKGHQTNASQARIQKRNRARAHTHTHAHTHTLTSLPHSHIELPLRLADTRWTRRALLDCHLMTVGTHGTLDLAALNGHCNHDTSFL